MFENGHKYSSEVSWVWNLGVLEAYEEKLVISMVFF